jgi:hypothetical protein
MLFNSALVVLTLTFHGHSIIEDWGIHVDHRYAIWVNISVVLILHFIHPVHYVSLIAQVSEVVRRFRPSIIVVVGLYSDPSPRIMSVPADIFRVSLRAHVTHSCHLCMICH